MKVTVLEFNSSTAQIITPAIFFDSFEGGMKIMASHSDLLSNQCGMSVPGSITWISESLNNLSSEIATLFRIYEHAHDIAIILEQLFAIITCILGAKHFLEAMEFPQAVCIDLN